MFKNFTRQLKKKTSQVLHSLAENLDNTPDDPNRDRRPESVQENFSETLSDVNAADVLTSEPEVTALAATVAEGFVPSVEAKNSVVTTEKREQRTDRVRIKVSATGVQLDTLNEAHPPSFATNPLAKNALKNRKPRRGLHPPAFVKKIGAGLAPVGIGWQRFRQHPRFWLILGVGLGVSSGAIAYFWASQTLEKLTQENIEAVASYAPPGTVTIKSSNGTILQEIGPVSHDQLKMGAIPPNIQNAFIASEDRRFNEHRGVDFQGIVRAAFSNVQAGGVKQGGSTITQQLARLVFLNQDRNFDRKIRELRLAQKIEEKFPKEQILERYLNLVYLGSGAYGVSDAAWAYFSKKPEQLSLGEAATLAGIVPAPSVYSPLENKDLATKQRNEVLRKMQDAGFITEAQKVAAIAEPLVIKPSPLKRFQRKSPYFDDYVLQELPKIVSEKALEKGGVTVITTLNDPWQENAQKILTKAVNDYGSWSRFSEGALVSINPKTGAIVTMVGGKDYQKNQFNRVTQAKRQPGSTFKPILYSAAIASGISPDKTYLNAPFTIQGYTPENYGDTYTGGPMSLRQALTNSVNVVAVRLLLDVGWNPVINLARKMGIQSKLEPTYSLALGAWEMTPLEMVSAYTTFPNKGVHVKPFAIQSVTDATGKMLYQNKLESQQALDPDSTAIMISMMKNVVANGTGRPAQLGDRQVAGKTGTSDKARDLWFIGYIPQLVTGVWLGNDNNQPTKGASSTAAMIWGDFMKGAVKGMPVEYFPAMPKKIEGRKPTIKAEPLKGHTIIALAVPNRSSNNQDTASSADNNTARTSRRRRRVLETATNDTGQTTRRSRRRSLDSVTNDTSQSTRRSRRRRSSVETANSNTSTSRRRSHRASASAATSSAINNGGNLPAPPAARKSE